MSRVKISKYHIYAYDSSKVMELLLTKLSVHLGFHTNRDEYLTAVVFDKTQSGKEKNFENMSEKYFTTFGLPYDCRSVLRYSGNHYSKDGSDTLIEVFVYSLTAACNVCCGSLFFEFRNFKQIPRVIIGQPSNISEKDLKKVYLMYCTN